MATQSTEITFQQTISDTAKSTLIEITSDFGGTNLSWNAPLTVGLVKVVDPLANTPYNNTTVASPDITALTKAFAAADVTDAADTITITNHGYSTGNPVVLYDTAGSGSISGLTLNNCYFIINVDANTVKLATTYANAVAGTAIDISSATGDFSLSYFSGTVSLPTDSDGELIQGQYTITVTLFSSGATGTQFERSQVINYIYDSPSTSLTSSYSVINPIFLKSIDSTNYTVDGVLPSISRTFTLWYPNGNGSLVTTTDTLSTTGFYGGSPAAHNVALSSVLTYTYATAYYSDNTGSLVPWYVSDTVTGADVINVYSNTSGCDLYCCLKKFNQRVEAAKGTQNYENLKTDFLYASALKELIESAYDCNSSEDVNDIRSEFDRVTGCSGDCSGCGDSVTQVIGIGTVPIQTRKYVDTATSNITNATYTGLIGKSFTNGDFAIIVDGGDVEYASGYTLSFNSITGTITFGNTIYSGTKHGWRLLGN